MLTRVRVFDVVVSERITQSIVKSHLETCQYSAEDMKRFTWVQYTPEETRVFQNKVSKRHHTADQSRQIESNEKMASRCDNVLIFVLLSPVG